MKAELILNGQRYRVMLGKEKPCAADLGVAVQMIFKQFGEDVQLWPMDLNEVVVYGLGWQVLFHKPLDL